MASTTTLKYGPKISLSHLTTKGEGGGPDPFVVKDYEKGLFFNTPLNYLTVIKVFWMYSLKN